MAASDEFARNWDIFQTTAVGIENVITLPAIANVSHVLTVVNASVIYSALNSVLTPISIFYQISGINTVIGYTPAVQTSATQADTGVFNWTGIVTAPPGLAVLVAFLAGEANTVQTLEVQGYDI